MSIDTKNRELESKLLAYELEVKNLEKETLYLYHKDQEIKQLQSKVTELLIERENLDSLLRKERSEFKNEIVEMENRKDAEILNLKSQISKINQKYETAQRYELYLTSVEKMNKELTEKLKLIEEEILKDKELAKEKYYLKLEKVKHKTLDFLGVIKKDSVQTALDNNSKSVKIMMLQNKELFTEISQQSNLIEELVGKLDEKENLIKQLKLEIQILKEVDRVLMRQKNFFKNLTTQVTEKANSVNPTTNLISDASQGEEKEKKKLIIFTKKTGENRSPNIQEPMFPSSRNRKDLDHITDLAYQTTNSIRNLKTTASDFRKFGRNSKEIANVQDQRITTGKDFFKNSVRTFKIVEKDETEKIHHNYKFLQNYKYYFDTVERFFEELKENKTKVEIIFSEEKLDQTVLNLIVKFIKRLHNEIKSKLVEQSVEKKLQDFNGKKEKTNKFRSKSILEELFKNSSKPGLF